jgi:alpha-D-ribose 1-methylphosphonate 5-phosphate C-P lyase
MSKKPATNQEEFAYLLTASKRRRRCTLLSTANLSITSIPFSSVCMRSCCVVASYGMLGVMILSMIVRQA